MKYSSKAMGSTLVVIFYNNSLLIQKETEQINSSIVQGTIEPFHYGAGLDGSES
jgi:hypothetical protein